MNILNIVQEDLSPGSPSKRPNAVLSYWVAGRLFLSPHPRECYVCYHDSAPQVRGVWKYYQPLSYLKLINYLFLSKVMIELAFRLAFGVHL